MMSEPKHKSYCNYPNDPCDCGVSPMYAPGSGFSRNPKLYTKGKSKPPPNIDLTELKKVSSEMAELNEAIDEDSLPQRLDIKCFKSQIEAASATMLKLATENKELYEFIAKIVKWCEIAPKGDPDE